MGPTSRRSVLLGAPSLVLASCRRSSGAQMLHRADDAGTPAIFIGPRAVGSPVAVFSHGLGARGDALRWLADPLAARGFLCVLPTHRESSGGALRDAWRSGASDGGLAKAIAAKVSDPVLERARSSDIAACLAAADPGHRAPFRLLVGHSMGAAATMIEAGAQTRFGRIGHDQFDAYVAISPEGPGSLFPPEAWSDIHKPVLIITGTRDRGTEGDWRWRASLFDSLPKGEKRLAVIPSAGHLQLGGLGAPRVRETVIALTTEFVSQVRARAFTHSRVDGADVRET